MIVIEGPDHVGKTTFAHTIQRESRFPIAHMSKPDESFDYFGDYIHQVAPDTIADRFHLGALVYGKFAGLHPTKLTPQRFWTLVRILEWMNVYVVILYSSSDEWLRQRLEKEGKNEMFGVDQILLVNSIYRLMASIGRRTIGTSLCNRSIAVDRVGFPNESIAREILKKYKERQVR